MDDIQVGVTKQYNMWVNYYIILLLLMNMSVVGTGIWLYASLFPLYGEGVWLLLGYYLDFYKGILLFYGLVVATFILKYPWFRISRKKKV